MMQSPMQRLRFGGRYYTKQGDVMKKIMVVGAGYVGLVTGACFAQQRDNTVIIVENNQRKIDTLLAGKVPFYEPGLDALVQQGIMYKKLIFVNTIEQALAYKPELVFSCVGTPSLPDGSADLSSVWAVAKEIGQHINNYCVVINKSTVPVGTAQKVRSIIEQQLATRQVSCNFDVVSNPEFLKEGDALNDFIKPDRVVIGTQSPQAIKLLRDLYSPFLASPEQLVVMNEPSAELTKYAANAMLATRISFINQIAQLADKVGANIDDIKIGISKDKRIGGNFLNAGIGYGGSCFPKDVKALVAIGLDHNQPMTLIHEVEQVNNNQRNWFVKKILKHYGPDITQKRAGILGLAFKPETDDIRCAPSIDIITMLLDKNVNISVYDPVATENVRALFKHTISYAQSALELLTTCDFVIILTEWKEFLQLQPEQFLTLTDKTIFDGRNCFNPHDMRRIGIKYLSIGRGDSAIEQEITGVLQNNPCLTPRSSEKKAEQSTP